MEQSLDIEKLVKEYMRNFCKHYRLPYGFAEEYDLLVWCNQIGKRYKDWTYYKGHYKDPFVTLSIRDPKWATLFELHWGHLIKETVDRFN